MSYLSISSETLKTHQLRVTDTRIKVLSLFLKKKSALSHAEIEKSLGKSFDRVTIYRILQSFQDSGIVHKIPDDSGIVKYALCDHCDSGHHHHQHIHFKCEVCSKTECLDENHLPEFTVPSGYLIKNADLLVQGVCKNCNK